MNFKIYAKFKRICIINLICVCYTKTKTFRPNEKQPLNEIAVVLHNSVWKTGKPPTTKALK
ncbi:hypothetical protein KUTeg_000073 [Tegillarca granosa]|uniref:Uncharacterized protein n=1 Tax=Tegillarca granosa TaxID=220873 RepID=A0ABQ9FXP6_TEGGR|nr:hypothetical protein KUTeg_000073 [Tegillarca granosa]